MYEVYRHHDSARVGLVEGVLTSCGIETFVKNWVGSNITEIPIPTIYPSVCVLKEEDIPEAQKVISEFFNRDNTAQENWQCSSCGETVDGFLHECWSCQRTKEIP